jgi:TolB-like protein
MPFKERAPWALSSPRPSIAIMPFKSIGSEDLQDYFSDGMTIEIVTALTGPTPILPAEA